MLALTVHEGSRVKVGDNVWITVLQRQGHNWRLGFEAPKEVRIVREVLITQPKSEGSEK